LWRSGIIRLEVVFVERNDGGKQAIFLSRRKLKTWSGVVG
jgi:hypothetical protein